MLEWLGPMMVGAAALGAAPACELRSGERLPQRLELYTSEGCSSCPPADRWLAQLPGDDERLVLAFHVDYWDELGWKDRYSDARYSARQHTVAVNNGSRTSYTPEVVVDGREYRGWRKGLPDRPARSAPVLPVRVELDPHLRLTLSSLERFPQAQTAYAAITEDAVESAIGAGENRGESLRHAAVVRAYEHDRVSGPALQISLELPQDLNRANARVVVWLEDEAGRTVQGLSRPLDACRVLSASE